MPGGGIHGTGPGQITDDSELAICQMHGLIQGNEDFKPGDDKDYLMSLRWILFWYGRWNR